jgi:hypothetical protein
LMPEIERPSSSIVQARKGNLNTYLALALLCR